MKKWIIGIAIVIALGLFGFFAFSAANKKTVYNEGYVNGNTASNLYNGGLFCEYGDTVYFANPDDGGRLYSMDKDGNNLKKLSSDTATYINVDENYIYYIRNNTTEGVNYNFFSLFRNALVRIDKDGKNILILDTDPCMYASLFGNYIYYIHYDQEEASTLYKICIDGTDKQKVSNEAVYTCNADGQYFYYNGMSKDGSIHRFDTATDSSTVVYPGNCFQPIVQNGHDIYYISGEHNYALVHTNLDYKEPTVLTPDSLDSYNVFRDYIYYQNYDEDGSALYMMNRDGSNRIKIMDGNYCDIHVTSYFVFFKEFYSGKQYYFFRATPNEIQAFSPGILDK